MEHIRVAYRSYSPTTKYQQSKHARIASLSCFYLGGSKTVNDCCIGFVITDAASSLLLQTLQSQTTNNIKTALTWKQLYNDHFS